MARPFSLILAAVTTILAQSVKRTPFATAGGGGLCGNRAGLNSGKNR